MIWARTDILARLPTPGGRDGGRLGLSVRTWFAEAATAADLTQASEIAGRYITLGSAARASRPVPGLVLEVQVPPKMSVRAQIIKNGPNRVQNRPFGLKLGPEACQDRSGAFGMGLTHSKGPSPAKKVKKCAQAALGLGILGP